jgi:signal transduction histidine kinase
MATYALQGMLKEWTPRNQWHLSEITLEEPDGSRLAALGTLSRNGDRLSAQSLLDLHGLTLVLRVARWFSTPHWMANTPLILVLLLALALAAVLWLLQRDMRKRLRTEAEFGQSQERLQRSARLASLGEMASMLSHELNQPLAAIASYATGSLNLMESEPHALDLFEIKTALERIASQSQRAGIVIKSINDFVRRRETERTACTPQSLFDGIVSLLSLQARQMGIGLSLRIDDNLPLVWCDKTLIEQVIFNLARNGMQSMMLLPARAVAQRQLRLTAQLEGESQVCFCVEDTGPGLSPEVQAKLFTPFFTTKPEGTGLGLSLCRTVIEQHGSTLTYTSQANTSAFASNVTRFAFRLSARPASVSSSH